MDKKLSVLCCKAVEGSTEKMNDRVGGERIYWLVIGIHQIIMRDKDNLK